MKFSVKIESDKMPFNPLMLNNINNNKKLKLPKEKPLKPKKSFRERLYCWLLIILSSILAGGEYPIKIPPVTLLY